MRHRTDTFHSYRLLTGALVVMSQMSAWRSSAMVQMWLGECGAQARPFSAAKWCTSSATGAPGALRLRDAWGVQVSARYRRQMADT
jgi:hypothetical protein